ncbi:MAG: ArsR/SmtB family transcription factor, partial [Gemmatimonadota bacterium]
MDTTTSARDLIDLLASLGDENRLRILVLLDRHELTVSELEAVLQLPQSTVSRHLKVLAGDEWIRSRQDGTSRFYRMSTALDADAGELWAVSRRAVGDAVWLEEDAERARAVIARRRSRSEEFFSE